MTAIAAAAGFNTYTPTFCCPMCSGELGQTAGVVPTIITACRHMVCLNCWTGLVPAVSNGARVCPICKEPANDAVPVSQLVNEVCDPDAAKQVAAIRTVAPDSLDAIIERNRKSFAVVAAKFTSQHQKVIEGRVDWVMRSVEKYLGDGPVIKGYIRFWEELPSFEKTLSLEPSKSSRTREKIQTDLLAVCKELQTYIDRICNGTNFRIVFHIDQTQQVGPKRPFVYLPHTIFTAPTPALVDDEVKKWRRNGGCGVEQTAVHKKEAPTVNAAQAVVKKAESQVPAKTATDGDSAAADKPVAKKPKTPAKTATDDDNAAADNPAAKKPKTPAKKVQPRIDAEKEDPNAAPKKVKSQAAPKEAELPAGAKEAEPQAAATKVPQKRKRSSDIADITGIDDDIATEVASDLVALRGIVKDSEMVLRLLPRPALSSTAEASTSTRAAAPPK